MKQVEITASEYTFIYSRLVMEIRRTNNEIQETQKELDKEFCSITLAALDYKQRHKKKLEELASKIFQIINNGG